MVRATRAILLFAAAIRVATAQEADLWLSPADGGDAANSDTNDNTNEASPLAPSDEGPDGAEAKAPGEERRLIARLTSKRTEAPPARVEEAPHPQAEDTVLTGAFTDLINNEAASDMKLRNEQAEDQTLFRETSDLKKRLHIAEVEDAKLKKLAALADSAIRSERSNYEKKIDNLDRQYGAKMGVLQHRAEAFRKLRAVANKTANKAKRQLFQERRHRVTLGKLAHRLKKKLNRTGESLKMSQLLLHRMRKVAEAEAASGNTTQAELEDAKKSETMLTEELAATQEQLANKNTQLKTLERQWVKDANFMRGAYEGAARAARRAEKNATQEAIELRAAGQAHELLSSGVDMKLRQTQAVLAASEQQAESRAKELEESTGELNSTYARLEQETSAAQRRTKEFREREEREEAELSAAKGQLAAGSQALNATKVELANSSSELAAVRVKVEAQRASHMSFVKTSEDLREKQEKLIEEVRQELVAKAKQLEDERAELSTGRDELSMTHRELSAALELVKTEKQTRSQLSKTAVHMKGRAEKEIGVLHANLSSAQEEMRATSAALAANDKELTGVRAELRKTEANAADLGKHVSAAKAGAKEEAAREAQRVRVAIASAQEEGAKRSALEGEVQAQDARIKEAEAHVNELRGQLRTSAAEAANQSSARQALQFEAGRLERAMLAYRAEAHKEILAARAAEEARSGELNSTQAKLAQVEAEARALRAEQAAEEKALRAERLEQQAVAEERAAQLHAAQVNASEQSAAREHLAEAMKKANAQVAELNATHVALAEEMGVTLEEFQSGSVQELREFRELHERLVQADEELAAARRELGGKTREFDESEAELNATRRSEAGAGAVSLRLSKANAALGDFRRLLAEKSDELNQTKASLAAAEAQKREVQSLQAKLDAAEEEAGRLHASLSSKSQELDATRTRLTATNQTMLEMSAEKEEVQEKFAALSIQLNLTKTELLAEDRDLNFTRKQLSVTLTAVDHLHEMRTKLGAAGKELKAYQDALGARTHELSAIRGELAAAGGLKDATSKAASAELEELEEVKAKLKSEGVQLLSMGSSLGKKAHELTEAKREMVVKDQSLLIAQAQLKAETSQVRQMNATRSKLVMLKMAEAEKLSELSSKLRAEHQELLQAQAHADKAAKASAKELQETHQKMQKVAQMAASDLEAKDEQTSAFLAQKDKAFSEMNLKLEAENHEAQTMNNALDAKKLALLDAQDKAKRAAQSELNERAADHATAAKNERLKVDLVDAATKEKEEHSRDEHLQAELAVAKAKADAQAASDKAADAAQEKKLETELAAATARADASQASAQKFADELAEQNSVLASAKSALNTSHVENDALQSRAEAADVQAQKLGQQVSQARELLSQDAELLRRSRDQDAKLKEKVSRKYASLKHKLEERVQNEEELVGDNQELKKEIARFQGSKAAQ